jgi:hypothetical protein
MSIGIDWTGLALGLLAGSAAAGLFFAGLALGLRLSRRRARPLAVLLPSAALRIALLLAAGWWVASALGAAAAAGFALAFLIWRTLLVAAMRPPREDAPWS